MKRLAVLFILVGSGLTAYGISGFSGELTNNTMGAAFDPEGSLAWSMHDRIEMVVGVLLLSGGFLLRKDSN